MSTAVSNRFQNKRSLIPNKKNSYYPVSWLINKLSFTCLLVLIPWIPLVILHQFNPRLLKSQVKVDELQVETINRLVNWKCQFIVRLKWNWTVKFQWGWALVKNDENPNVKCDDGSKRINASYTNQPTFHLHWQTIGARPTISQIRRWKC